MCIFELSAVLKYEFDYDYSKKIWQQVKTIIHRHW